MRQYGIPKLDILKMDIEGAEENVFASNPERWLPFVDLIVIEIHGSSELKLIANVLRNNGFTMVRYRSLWYCVREH